MKQTPILISAIIHCANDDDYQQKSGGYVFVSDASVMPFIGSV